MHGSWSKHCVANGWHRPENNGQSTLVETCAAWNEVGLYLRRRRRRESLTKKESRWRLWQSTNFHTGLLSPRRHHRLERLGLAEPPIFSDHHQGPARYDPGANERVRRTSNLDFYMAHPRAWATLLMREGKHGPTGVGLITRKEMSGRGRGRAQ